jgi:hypothetical protein
MRITHRPKIKKIQSTERQKLNSTSESYNRAKAIIASVYGLDIIEDEPKRAR